MSGKNHDRDGMESSGRGDEETNTHVSDGSTPTSDEQPPPLPPKKYRYGPGGVKRDPSPEPPSEEDQEIPQPPRKKKQKSRRTIVVSSDDDNEEGGQNAVASNNKPKARSNLALSLSNPLNQQINQERAWQRAMDVAVALLVPLKVDINALTLLPDAGTLECYRKAAQAYMTERKVTVPLTYTTSKSFAMQVGRFMFAFTMRHAGIAVEDWSPSGCVIWQHGCGEVLRCLHGSQMIKRTHTVEMDVASENGQRALKEDPTRAKVTTNKWGRSVVQLCREDAACCVNDAACQGGNFSSRSCGMFFPDGMKAMQAFRQAMEFQSACYPKMSNAATHLLMPTSCECNWGPRTVPLLGRQVCKLTPFAIHAVDNIDKSQVTDERILATLHNPSVLVFQCCNPVYRGSKAAAPSQRNCDFKISAPDVITALQVAKGMWLAMVKEPVPLMLPEFKWSPQLQFQNTVLPAGQFDADDCLF